MAFKLKSFMRVSTSLCSVFCVFLAQAADSLDFRGQLGLEFRQFLESGNDQQDSSQASAYVQPEWSWYLDDADIVFVPFYRYDSMDNERSHGDVRELYYFTSRGDYNLTLGISKVFWGITESAHLVDVINQTDSIESVDGEDKLGQPMLHFTAVKDWGVTEFFILPYFRERTFSGQDGRLRTPVPIQTDHAQYESASSEKHVDYAFRYSNTFGDWDFGISYLDGTDREPSLLVLGGEIVPYYSQMQHVGVDVQGIIGDWLWKLESVYKNSYQEYVASVGGFEYTHVGLFGTVWDLGLLAEYLYDSRGENSFAVGQNDLFAGFRFAMNDEASSELLFGMAQDLDNSSSQYFKLEASTRLSQSMSLAIDAWAADSDNSLDPLYSLKNDDFVQASLEYYF